LAPLGVDLHRERFRLVLGRDQLRCLGRGDQVVGDDQRDRLAAVGDVIAA